MASRGESVFFKGVASGRSTRLHWKAAYPGIYEWHKMDSVGYVFKGKCVGCLKRGTRGYIWVELKLGVRSKYD